VSDQTGSITVFRPEAAADSEHVHALLLQAFGRLAEAELVIRLRRDGDLVLATVAIKDACELVGHVAFSRLHVVYAGQEFPAVGLAPLAVAAPYRRQGIGGALVHAGLDCLVLRGEALAFVLGDPAYYSRFDFAPGVARPFTCAYAGPHFMALRLKDAAPPAGQVRYPAAFGSLG
jgi:putative acetyltransferase